MSTRVVYVDGDPDRRERTAARVERAGSVRVFACGEPREALELLRVRSVDCVVTIASLAGWTGSEVAAAVRRERPDVPVVVSASVDGAAAEKLGATADAFCRRPAGDVPVDAMLDRIGTVTDDAGTDGEVSPRPPTRSRNRATTADGSGGSGDAADRETTGRRPPGSDGGRRTGPPPESDDRVAARGRSTADATRETTERGSATRAEPTNPTDAGGGADTPERDTSDGGRETRETPATTNASGAGTDPSLDGPRVAATTDGAVGSLIGNAPWPIVLTRLADDGPTVEAVNPAFEETFGVTAEELRNDSLDAAIVPDGREASAEGLNRAARDGQPFSVEVERDTADGVRSFLLTLVPAEATDEGLATDAVGTTEVADGTETARTVGTTDETDTASTADDEATESLVWGMYADVGDRIDQRERVRRLHEVALTLSDGTEPAAIYEETVTAAMDVLPADRVVAYADRDDRLTAVESRPTPDDSPVDTEQTDENVVERAHTDGDGYLATDRGNSRPAPGDEATVAVPIGAHGALRVGADETDRFDKFDLDAATLLAAHAGTALDRNAREDALARRETQLERHNERLERFAGLVSHDLRTPLEVARGNVELGMLDDDSDRLETAIDALDRANDLIEDMLTFARTGEHVTDESRVPVARVARDAWTAEFDAAGSLVVETTRVASADEDRLRQLFANLYRNAVEHGRASDDDRVTVRVIDTPDGFAVADDGPGLPDEADDLFAPGVSTAEDGTGFGLSLVQEIAAAHGWRVTPRDGFPADAVTAADAAESATETDSTGACFEIHTE